MTEISYFLYKLLAEINLGKFTGKSTTDFLGITIAVKYITLSSAYRQIVDKQDKEKRAKN